MTATHLTTFFERMGELEPIMRIVLGGAEVSAMLTFRGEPDRRVLLDFTQTPARIAVDDETHAARIQLAVPATVMHEVLLGRLHPGEAFGRRELLIRGRASDLARFLPLMDFAPLLYREHLADRGVPGFARSTGYAPCGKEAEMDGRSKDGIPRMLRERSQRAVRKLVDETAYAAGYGLGLLRHRFFENMSLFDLLGAMSRGLDAARRHTDERG